jgi:hypothetical protein
MPDLHRSSTGADPQSSQPCSPYRARAQQVVIGNSGVCEKSSFGRLGELYGITTGKVTGLLSSITKPPSPDRAEFFFDIEDVGDGIGDLGAR